jgi:acyl carrier protein
VTITERVREYICVDLAAEVGRDDLTPDYPLIDSGVLDSISTFQLFGFLREHYEIDIDDVEMTYQNLQNLAAIAGMVEAKLAARGGVAQPASSA